MRLACTNDLEVSHVGKLPLHLFALPEPSDTTLPINFSGGHMVSNLPCSYNRHEAASVRVAASFLAVQRHRAAYRSDPIDQWGAMGVTSKGEFFYIDAFIDD